MLYLGNIFRTCIYRVPTICQVPEHPEPEPHTPMRGYNLKRGYTSQMVLMRIIGALRWVMDKFLDNYNK